MYVVCRFLVCMYVCVYVYVSVCMCDNSALQLGFVSCRGGCVELRGFAALGVRRCGYPMQSNPRWAFWHVGSYEYGAQVASCLLRPGLVGVGARRVRPCVGICRTVMRGQFGVAALRSTAPGRNLVCSGACWFVGALFHVYRLPAHPLTLTTELGATTGVAVADRRCPRGHNLTLCSRHAHVRWEQTQPTPHRPDRSNAPIEKQRCAIASYCCTSWKRCNEKGIEVDHIWHIG